MTVKPITPDEVANARESVFPDFVIEEWNKIIAENAGSSKTFNLKVGVPARRLKNNAQARGTFYESSWLNIETLYANYGWKVTYDRPGYNETYEGSYTFKPA